MKDRIDKFLDKVARIAIIIFLVSIICILIWGLTLLPTLLSIGMVILLVAFIWAVVRLEIRREINMITSNSKVRKT